MYAATLLFLPFSTFLSFFMVIYKELFFFLIITEFAQNSKFKRVVATYLCVLTTKYVVVKEAGIC